jgi:hypothetical protein
VGHRLLAAIDRADDEQPVGITVEKRDDDVPIDPRRPPDPQFLPAQPWSIQIPARAVLVVFAEQAPVELNLDAATLVGPDLLAPFADDRGGLRAVNARFNGRASRPESSIPGKAVKLLQYSV